MTVVHPSKQVRYFKKYKADRILHVCKLDVHPTPLVLK